MTNPRMRLSRHECTIRSLDDTLAPAYNGKLD